MSPTPRAFTNNKNIIYICITEIYTKIDNGLYIDYLRIIERPKNIKSMKEFHQAKIKNNENMPNNTSLKSCCILKAPKRVKKYKIKYGE